MKEKNLIFIASQPRSGSTLLQNLLSNNDITNTSSEPWAMFNFISYYRPDLYYAKFDLNLSNDAIKDYFEKNHNEDVDSFIKNTIKNVYRPMFKNGYEFVIDKTPRYYEILNELISIFPESKIVILKRNPIDVIKSIIKTWNISSLEALFKHNRDVLIAPFLIHDFCENNKDNPNVLVVKYEDIVYDTEKEVSSLYKKLGIEYNKLVLNIKKNKKYKGKYGDPYLNNGLNNREVIKTKNEFNTDKQFDKFIQGYVNFLGEDFLEIYGNYEYKRSKKTLEFSYYYKRFEIEKHFPFFGLKNEIYFRGLKLLLKVKGKITK